MTRLLFVPQPVPELLACSWCDAIPGEPHDRECPERGEAEPDFPATCSRCGVTYITNCDCSKDEDRDR